MAVSVLSSLLTIPPAEVEAARGAADKMKREVARDHAELPLTFVENMGQARNPTRYLTQGAGYSFSFGPERVVISLGKQSAGRRTAPPNVGDGVTVALEFVGSEGASAIEGRVPSGGKVNYLVGDRSRWRTGLTTYEKVVYSELWPGIDMVFSGARGTLKYEFLVRPGARVDDIELAYKGVKGLSIESGGGLALETSAGTLEDSAPTSYQRANGARVEVQSLYQLRGANAYGFTMGPAYDPFRRLTIDPGLAYSTFLGGTTGAQGMDIALDGSGNAYVAGLTHSTDYSTTGGAWDTTFNGLSDAFVTKLNATGSGLLYSTYLGGASGEHPFGIAVDAAGNAYVTGRTTSSDYPTTTGAYDTTFGGNSDAFVTKLNATGSGLLYSTYIGGPSDDEASGIAIDGAGHAYVTGTNLPSGYPTTMGAYDTTSNGSSDVFVTKLNGGGSDLEYSTLIGGGLADIVSDIAVDAAGNAYVTGRTTSSDYPTTAGAVDTTSNGDFDVFVTKLDTSGSGLGYSTLLGGASADSGEEIALDAIGTPYVAGLTGSSGFPTTVGAFDETFNGGNDAFVTKLESSGSGLAYSTFVGSISVDQGWGLAVDGSGNAYVTGLTHSSGFPTTTDAFDTTFNGSNDVFVTKLNGMGSALAYSTFLGGSTNEAGWSVAVDGDGNAYVTGFTQSTDLPTTPGAFDVSFNGQADAFITKLATVVADLPPQCQAVGAILGTNGHDSLTGTPGDDVLCGLEGNDTMVGAGGQDVLYGHAGNDTLWGGAGDDVIHGHFGNDTLWGHAGNDALRGYAGNDTLWGHAGNDSLKGHSGNDSLSGGPHVDSCNGGSGVNEIILC